MRRWNSLAKYGSQLCLSASCTPYIGLRYICFLLLCVFGNVLALHQHHRSLRISHFLPSCFCFSSDYSLLFPQCCLTCVFISPLTYKYVPPSDLLMSCVSPVQDTTSIYFQCISLFPVPTVLDHCYHLAFPDHLRADQSCQEDCTCCASCTVFQLRLLDTNRLTCCVSCRQFSNSDVKLILLCSSKSNVHSYDLHKYHITSQSGALINELGSEFCQRTVQYIKYRLKSSS